MEKMNFCGVLCALLEYFREQNLLQFLEKSFVMRHFYRNIGLFRKREHWFRTGWPLLADANVSYYKGGDTGTERRHMVTNQSWGCSHLDQMSRPWANTLRIPILWSMGACTLLNWLISMNITLCYGDFNLSVNLKLSHKPNVS